MTIKLEDFIADSLTQIANGVKKAQEDTKNTGAVISPKMRQTRDSKSIGEVEGLGGQPCYKVEFDIAVTANEKSKTTGGIGVAVGVIALGSKGESNDELKNTSKIQFSIPIVLPQLTFNPSRGK